MQFHCMNVISSTISSLNPGQIPVDTANQPIFALTKELMIRFPDKLGPNKYFCLFGSLHIETALLIICGRVIRGNGLDEFIYTCSLSIVGADSLVTVNNIKRASYCLQFEACVIYSKLKQAHRDSGSDELIPLWLAKKSKINEMFLLEIDSRLMCLSSYDFFERANIHSILHRYINSYDGTLLWTAITMLDGSQFTSMICCLYLKTRHNYISLSWMDVSLSKKIFPKYFSFHLWDQIKFTSRAML